MRNVLLNIFLLLSFCTFSQEDTPVIRGSTLTKGSDEPLVFVSVKVIGFDIETLSDLDGCFKIKIPNKNRMDEKLFITASYIGFTFDTLLITKKNINDIVLYSNASTITCWEAPVQFQEPLIDADNRPLETITREEYQRWGVYEQGQTIKEFYNKEGKLINSCISNPNYINGTGIVETYRYNADSNLIYYEYRCDYAMDTSGYFLKSTHTYNKHKIGIKSITDNSNGEHHEISYNRDAKFKLISTIDVYTSPITETKRTTTTFYYYKTGNSVEKTEQTVKEEKWKPVSRKFK